MKTATWSLSRRLTLAIMAFQALILLAATAIGFALVFRASQDGVIVHPQLLDAVGASVLRSADGALALDPTPDLREFMSSSPDLWIVVRDRRGEELFYGPLPEIASYMMDVSGELKTIDIRGSDGNAYLTSRFDRVDSPAGPVSIWAGGGALVSDGWAVFLLTIITAGIPIALLLIVTATGLPLLVRSSLRSIRKVSEQIERIDYGARGTQVEVARLPLEIFPMVQGLNEALRRLDDGAETTERFFVHAAHELRTPIAILQVRADALEPGTETDKIRQVVRRLAALANQLLSIETFRQRPFARKRLPLDRILEEAVADLAPYAVAEGYTIALEGPQKPVFVEGDEGSLDRMFVNLIQNAVQHGGHKGAITVRLTDDARVEVSDEGPGIADRERERVFDAFYRVNGHGSGSGLGLKMVRDIALAHGGEVVHENRTEGGSTFRVSLPTVA